MKGIVLATPEEMQAYIDVIIGLHACDTYCKHDFLGLFHLRFSARGYEHAAARVTAEFENASQEEPLIVGRRTDDGEFQFYFAQPVHFDELVGDRLFHFRPPPLCPGKLIAKALEDASNDCPPKGGFLH